MLEGLRGCHLEDSVSATMTADHRRNGQDHNPTHDPICFTTAYFHQPEELATECESVGLTHEVTVAVEGPGWLLPDLEARLAEERRRSVLLEALAALETEPTRLGMSAHRSNAKPARAWPLPSHP